MASWMIHLRIADKLLDRIPGLSPIEFIMGSMAPDSGVPNEDWSAFTPDKTVSHFQSEGKIVDPHAYYAGYFTPRHRTAYDDGEYAFHLGYLTHLITDVVWHDEIYLPCRARCAEEIAADEAGFISRVKADWYDLDFLYLKKHPGFRAFRAYLGSVGFVNRYLDFFPTDAFENRRQYITDFYLQRREGLDREYPYLTEERTDHFVEDTAARIVTVLETLLSEDAESTIKEV